MITRVIALGGACTVSFQPTSFGAGGTFGPMGSQEAQSRAEGLFRQMARRFVVGRGTAQTDAKLRVGARVELTGLGPMFSGKYHLAEVKHLFDAERGLRTEFVAERAGLGRAS